MPTRKARENRGAKASQTLLRRKRVSSSLVAAFSDTAKSPAHRINTGSTISMSLFGGFRGDLGVAVCKIGLKIQELISNPFRIGYT